MPNPAELSSKASFASNSSEKHRLPIPLAPLIGREQETAQLRQLLSRLEVRLVTITGPGGVGKTSLALHVAHQLGDAFAEGAHFISLAAIRDPTLIIPTLAQALGLAESPDRLLFDSLKDFLRGRQILLLVDNFEQVISAAPLLTELLSACGELKLLVTSRETLRLRGEREFPLAPLELSDRAQMPNQPSVGEFLKYSSIALFVKRARSSQPDFQLTADNATAVAQICARLDGLPLAIELAAARIRLLPPHAMLARLQDSSLSLLTGGARDAPARQKTLRDAIQWSYDLLNAEEQRAFRVLSVFTGGCTIEAAEAVLADGVPATGHGGFEPLDAGLPSSVSRLDLLASLVDKNLVRRTSPDSEARLGMLETLREFGLNQLDQTNELEAAQRAYAQYYLSMAEETEQHLLGREQKAWLNRLGREQDNLRAALRWGFEHHEAGFVLRLVGALWQFWFLRGQWSEGRRWLEEALAMASKAEVNTALRARLLYAAAILVRKQYDFARARVLCEQSITLYRALGDKEGLLTALHELCRILDYQGEDELLRALVPEVLTLVEELPDVAIKADAYAMLHLIAHDSISSGTAARYLAESERIYRALDNPAGLASTLFVQGAVADLQGDPARGQTLRDEGERLAAQLDDLQLRLLLLAGRAVSAWQSDDDVSARRSLEQLIGASREVDERTGQTNLILSGQGNFYLGQRNLFLGIFAAVLHRQGLSVWAARVYGLADKLAPTSESPRMGGEVFATLRQRAAAARAEVRARLGNKAFNQALTEEKFMSVEDLLRIPHPPPSELTTQAPASFPYEALTGRELEVLRLLSEDLSNPQIAERLVISRRTVDAHLRAIYAKLEVGSRNSAIRIAREYGLIDR